MDPNILNTIGGAISRRGFFLKATGSATAMLLAPTILSGEELCTGSLVAAKPGDRSLLDPIVPFKFYPDLENEMLGYLREMNRRYGFRRFLLIGPSKEFRYTGFPAPDVFTDLGNQVRKVKDILSPEGIEIGWWCTTTIRIGKGSFQSIVRADGSIATEACCPLDPEYRKTFSGCVASVVRIAEPFLVNFEDDYHLSGGCYCPLHLEEFSRRNGRYYTRVELQEIFNTRSPESNALKKSWGEMSRDSLAGLAASVRAAVDKVAPSTRLCLCQSGASERDGNFTEAVTQAFAGHTKPMVRVHGTSYFSDSHQDIPATIFNPLYQRQHLPPDFEIIHESDTFPHTRFFMSSSKIKTLLTCALAYGLDDSLLYVTQYLENPLEERGYCEMYLREARRFSALKQAVQKCRVDGCEIYRRPGTSSSWVHVTGRLGIPHTAKGGGVKLVSGNTVEHLDESEILDLLKGGVFLDGQAAATLSERGYARLIGAEVFPREKTALPPFYEGIKSLARHPGIQNRLMYNYVWAFGKSPHPFFQIRPVSGAEILTEFLDLNNKPYFPGMTRFENELGGRVGVMSFNLDDSYIQTRSISTFNYTKKQLLRETLEWIGKASLPVFVESLPNVFCIFSRSESDRYAVVVLVNLCSDTFGSVPLKIAPEWRTSTFETLSQDGKWNPAKTELRGEALVVNAPLSLMDPVILKFTK